MRLCRTLRQSALFGTMYIRCTLMNKRGGLCFFVRFNAISVYNKIIILSATNAIKYSDIQVF